MGMKFIYRDRHEGYAISAIPERKRVALCRVENTRWTPIAYFFEEQEAEKFIQFLSQAIQPIEETTP